MFDLDSNRTTTYADNAPPPLAPLSILVMITEPISTVDLNAFAY